MNVRGSTSRLEDLSDIPSEDAALASCERAFWRRFPLALRITPATFGERVLEGLPPPEEARWRFFPFLRDALPICAILSSRNAAAELL